MIKERSSLLISSAIFLASFALYLSTLSPGIYFGDTGELIAMAHTLGIPHPTGFPLYILLLKLFTLLPAGNTAFASGIMSALFGALVPVMVYLTARLMLKAETAGKPQAPGSLPAALVPALLMALSYTLWSQTSAARIYTLNAFFISLMLYMWFKLIAAEDVNKTLYLFAFTTGIGAALHLSFIVISVILWIFLFIRYFSLIIRKIPALAFFLMLGFSIYLYIIMRGLAPTELHWKNFTSAGDFIAYFTQQQYRVKMASRGLEGYIAFFRYAAEVMLREFSIPGFMALAAGLAYSFYKKKSAALPLALVILTPVALLAFYGNYSDLKLSFRYYIPSYIAFCLLLVYALHALSLKLNRPVYAAVIISSAALITAFMLPRNYFENNRAFNFTAYDYLNDILKSMPEDKAYIFISGDNQIYPLAYARYVEGRAKNLTVYDNITTIFRDISDLSIRTGSFKFISNAIRAIEDGKTPVFSATKAGVPVINESLNGIIYGLSDKGRRNSNYLWKTYPLRFIHNNTYHEFEEREVLGTYFYRYAEKYLSEGNGKSAYYMVTMAENTGYDSIPVLGNTALIYGMYNDHENASRLINMALKLNPNNTELLFNLASTYARQGKFLQAAETFEKVTKLDPTNMNAMLYMQKAKEQHMAAMSQKAVADVRDGAYNEAVKLFNEKKFDEAIPKFMEDFSKNPDMARSEFHLAIIYSMRTEYDKAIPYYESALRKEPENTNTLNNLALTYGRMGQTGLAKKYFRQSLKINPDQQRVKDMLSKLR